MSEYETSRVREYWQLHIFLFRHTGPLEGDTSLGPPTFLHKIDSVKIKRKWLNISHNQKFFWTASIATHFSSVLNIRKKGTALLHMPSGCDQVACGWQEQIAQKDSIAEVLSRANLNELNWLGQIKSAFHHYWVYVNYNESFLSLPNCFCGPSKWTAWANWVNFYHILVDSWYAKKRYSMF